MWLVATFPTTTAAITMERLCGQLGLPGRLIPVPRSISASCGMAWRRGGCQNYAGGNGKGARTAGGRLVLRDAVEGETTAGRFPAARLPKSENLLAGMKKAGPEDILRPGSFIDLLTAGSSRFPC